MKNIFLLILLAFAVDSFALKPDLKYSRKPNELQISFKEYFISTPDNCKLKTWVCSPQKDLDNKTTLILAYGDAGNMSYWLSQVAELVKNGFTVVTFDYRGFGESDSFKIDTDYLYYNEFVIDLVSVIRWTKHNIAENQTGIWALSMGTIMSTLALQEESVDFLIAEGFVISPLKIKQSIKALKNKEILLPAKSREYEKSLLQLSVKTLLFSGKQDIVTTVKDSEFVKNLNKQNHLIAFDGNHLQGFQVLSSTGFGDRYITEIIEFLR
ncbi:MAG: alpha/beta fold hydrolase [Sphaerochaetaceae bacterium]|jgi:pimeloyl-ACP methyl ester carboxylesterase